MRVPPKTHPRYRQLVTGEFSPSFQEVDAEKGVVKLYAPVFTGVKYRIAEPVADYIGSFGNALPKEIHPVFSAIAS
jgi:hypothetical protein